MPTPASTLELLDLVRKSGILTEPPPSPAGLPADAVQSAAVLVQKGVLTRFQAKLLLTGRHRGFKLGPYVIREQLGQGGMGAVYLAEHEGLRRRVAIKVLTPPKDDPNAQLTIERFLREARSVAALDHPNIVRIHDVARQVDVHYLVMEHVDGTTLEQLIERGGPITPGRAVGYIAQAAAGLQHAYEKGFVHRDIKPANLILAKDGTVKILDMGLARSAQEGDKLTEVLDRGAIVGTADYISPEQAMNAPRVDVRADIYSLGATFYALVTGKPPFGGNTTQKLIQHQMKDATPLADVDRTFPDGLSEVVAKMMHKKPEKRYAQPADVIAALAPWLTEEGGGRVMAGLSGTDAGGSGGMQHTITEIVSGSTKRLNKSKKLGAAPGGNTRIVYAAAGLAVAAAVGVVGWAVFGRGDSAKPVVPAVAKADPTPPFPVPTPAPTPTPKPANPKPAAVKPGLAAGAVVYKFDAAAVGAFTFTTRGTDTQTGITPAFPAGVGMFTYGPDSVGTFAGETVAGRAAVGFAVREGKPTGQVSFDLETAGGVTLADDRDYVVRVEYLNRGDTAPHINVQNLKFETLQNQRLSATKGEWKTGTMAFRRPAGVPVRLTLDAYGPAGSGMTYMASFEVVEAGGGPAAPPPPQAELFKLDAAGLVPFRDRGKIVTDPRGEWKLESAEKTGAGLPPAGWELWAWKQETEPVFLADAEFGPALGFGTHAGPATVMLFTPAFAAPAAGGRVEIEYRSNGATGDPAGTALGVRCRGVSPDKKAWDLKNLPATNGEWKTAAFDLDALGCTKVLLELHNPVAGPGVLRIRKLRVTGSGDGPAATPTAVAGPAVLEYSFEACKPFRYKFENRKSETDPDTVFPAGVKAYAWKAESVIDVTGEAIDGGFAVGVTNLNDAVSGQILFVSEPKKPLTPGKSYRVRVEYLTRNDAAGHLVVHGKDYQPLAEVPLPNTSGEWKTAELTFARKTDPTGGVIGNDAVGEGNTLLVRKIELFEGK